MIQNPWLPQPCLRRIRPRQNLLGAVTKFFSAERSLFLNAPNMITLDLAFSGKNPRNMAALCNS